MSRGVESDITAQSIEQSDNIDIISCVTRQCGQTQTHITKAIAQIRQELIESHTRVLVLLEHAASEAAGAESKNMVTSDMNMAPRQKQRFAFEEASPGPEHPNVANGPLKLHVAPGPSDAPQTLNCVSVMPFHDSDVEEVRENGKVAVADSSNNGRDSSVGWRGKIQNQWSSPSSARSRTATEGSLAISNAKSPGATQGSLAASSTSRFGTQFFPRATRMSVLQEGYNNQRTRQAIFFDPEVMKEKVRKAIMDPKKVEVDFYWETGMWSTIAKDHKFTNSSLFVIFVNALWFAVEATWNDEPNPIKQLWVFQLADHLFCTFFTFEISVRFMALKRKRDGFKDKGFAFDFFLACTMILETWVLLIFFLSIDMDGETGRLFQNTSFFKFVRLLRLLKMGRLFRIVRALPEAYILIKGILVAARSVGVTLVLLLSIMYVFTIIFMSLAKGTPLERTYFKSVISAMKYLLLSGILPDQQQFVIELMDEDLVMGWLSLAFILLGSLTVMNMLIGILVQVVQTVTYMDKEQMEVSHAKRQMEILCQSMDKNNDHMITIHEVQQLLEDRDTSRMLQGLGVDVVGLVDMAEFIFGDNNEIDESAFMEAVLEMRGDNTAKVKDIVDLRKMVFNVTKLIEKNLKQSSSWSPVIVNPRRETEGWVEQAE